MNSRIVIPKWLQWFLVFMFIASAVFSAVYWVKVDTQLSQLQGRISVMEAEQRLPDSSEVGYVELDYYRDINAKMDSAIDRIIALVGITTAAILVFGFLLAYRAPLDTERELDKLRTETGNAKESAEEARYQASISLAGSSDTPHDRIIRFDSVIAAFPQKADAYQARGDVFFEIGQYDKAISDFEAAFKRGGDKSEYLNSIASAYAKSGSLERAEGFFSQVIEENPNDPTPFANRAIARGDLGNYEEALEDFRQALLLDPNDPIVLTNRALTYRQMARGVRDEGQRRSLRLKAIEDFRSALELDPKNARISSMLKREIEGMGDFESSDTEIVEILSEIERMENALGDSAAERKDYAAAVSHYSRSIDASAMLLAANNKNIAADDPNLFFEKLGTTTAAGNIVRVVEEGGISTEEERAEIGHSAAPLLMDAAMKKYLSHELLQAERLYSVVAESDSPAADFARTNLAYMRRRNETSETTRQAMDLLNDCQSKDARTGVWAMNMALCYADGVGVPKNLDKFIDIIKGYVDQDGALECFEWWSQVGVVGSRESNLALLGLSIAGFGDLGDPVPQAARLIAAWNDGYQFAWAFDAPEYEVDEPANDVDDDAELHERT